MNDEFSIRSQLGILIKYSNQIKQKKLEHMPTTKNFSPLGINVDEKRQKSKQNTYSK